MSTRIHGLIFMVLTVIVVTIEMLFKIYLLPLAILFAMITLLHHNKLIYQWTKRNNKIKDIRLSRRKK